MGIYSPPGGGITWTDVTGTSQAMSADKGYVANNSGLVTLTLPSPCAVGKLIYVSGQGSGGWKIAQNASQIIHLDNTDSTTGVGGSIASNNRYDSVVLVCTVADTEFQVVSSMGVITIN